MKPVGPVKRALMVVMDILSNQKLIVKSKPGVRGIPEFSESV
jgi:hypothetical protein